jgi:hypothetical protein
MVELLTEVCAKRNHSPASLRDISRSEANGKLRLKLVVSPEKSGLVSRWKCDAPKFPGIFIVVDKLNGIRGNAVPCEQLRNHPR